MKKLDYKVNPKNPHPMPCAHCGHATRMELDGLRCCWKCFDRERGKTA